MLPVPITLGSVDSVILVPNKEFLSGGTFELEVQIAIWTYWTFDIIDIKTKKGNTVLIGLVHLGY